MNPDTRHQTARIYQFPLKPHRIEQTARFAASAVNEQRLAPAADFGSGWYHDAAIKTDQARPHAG